jgi:hypothetical protein
VLEYLGRVSEVGSRIPKAANGDSAEEQRAAQCWGGGLNGHLGNGSTADSLAVANANLTNVSELSMNGASNCVVTGTLSTIKGWVRPRHRVRGPRY